MDEMPENNNKNPEPPKNQPPQKPLRRPPFALLVWFVIFGLGIFFLIARYNDPGATHKEWSQTDFENHLFDGTIVSVTFMPETDRIFFAEGEFDPQKNNETHSPDSNLTALKGGNAAPLPTFSARVFLTDAMMEELQKLEAKVKYLQRDNWKRDLLVNLAIALVIIGAIYFLFARQIRNAGQGAMQFGKNKARMIMPDEHRKTFDDVAGCDEAKEETKEIIDYLRDPLKYKLLGGKIPRGALLTGPPGTGKTLLAKAISGEATVPFFAISGSDFVEMFVGVGASRVRDMFDQARKHAPCLIFIDEIDAVGRSRFSGIGGGHDEREQTLNALLVEMDGLETQEGVIVLAATNRADVLDPALLRPGRFDRQIVIDLPDINGRLKILEVHARSIKLEPSVSMDTIARTTPGFSGADLANLINEAALLAARSDRTAANQNDLEEARDKVCFGRERRSRRITERERRLTAWHEAGHALVALLCEYCTPLHKVTIIPRGFALGLTMTMPEEDRYSKTRLEMLDDIAMAMGGRVAEEIALGDISSGASQDIAQATRIAHEMVCTYGMSDKLGAVQYGERAEHIYLGRDITRNDSYSEETAREIDNEVKRIVTGCKEKATTLLTENRAMLDKLANELLEKETLDVAYIRQLLGLPDPHSH